ncbi:PhzF family phenazine biosynthesis protein [Subtercola sp. PAMC28395]|uniref:PhzF family phenazine biosynthesis protein n=1 Tax=Subtercola sp. PAMC28395 TaxID=2846775 RepID=UPI00209B5898|nr:PhzF family phenazine biosynthesis protein [Subtercola sp. PAMC28395]
MRTRAFTQVDVFTAVAYRGNPLAVVLDAEGIDDASMARFANWTNLSETTFLLPPTLAGAEAGADYRVRIFTPSSELPFAGHPTLGSAHAWLEAGGVPRESGIVVQECGVGLVQIRVDAASARLAFAAPPLLRSGPIDSDELTDIVAALGISPADVVDSNWVDNGPGWAGVLLATADAVLAAEPDFDALGERSIGIVGPRATAAGHPEFEVRGFAGGVGVREDPVTGSLNASLAQWMIGAGHAPTHYLARQGTRLGRDGLVDLDLQGGQVWVGGQTVTCVTGSVLL